MLLLSKIALIVNFLEAVNVLMVFRANGNDELASDLQLLEKSRRDLGSTSANVDCVVGSFRSIALSAVTAEHFDLASLQLLAVGFVEILH